MMMREDRLITVNSRKYDGSLNRQWECQLVDLIGEQIVLKGVFEKHVIHETLGEIRAGTVSYEYFWKSRWYNVFRFHEPSGALRNYYCNISAPPTWEPNVLDYVDLDIDVVVWPDGEYKILDLEEFRAHSVKFGYSPDVIAKANESLAEVLSIIRTNQLPAES